MRMHTLVATAVMLFAAVVVFAGCGGDNVTSGTLQFYANGEDFVRQGFVSKDGWSITFDHVYINLADIAAYQTDPPYDPHEGGEMMADVEIDLSGSYTVDLAEGDENADRILVGEVQDAGAGHYNAISWRMVKAASGSAAGYSLVMIGTAEKDSRVVDFAINIDEECGYKCGEYVGDERKGILTDGGTADLEMTFHFDHIFGDAETPLDDALNLGAIGFEPFAASAEGGQVDIEMTELHLGHVGEGHCQCLCE